MFSLGEIESNCTKAARGAGLSWGVAQDCGLVARHLTELGLPGADAVFFNLKFINENHIRTILDKGWMEKKAKEEARLKMMAEMPQQKLKNLTFCTQMGSF